MAKFKVSTCFFFSRNDGVPLVATVGDLAGSWEGCRSPFSHKPVPTYCHLDSSFEISLLCEINSCRLSILDVISPVERIKGIWLRYLVVLVLSEFFMRSLKVRKSQKHFMVPLVLPKNEPKIIFSLENTQGSGYCDFSFWENRGHYNLF